ncbi:type II secretion system protein F [Abditibacteriota bacterium]|nr:type II secretion system protein F [Abditibacteriota bacterium]
MAHFRYEGFDQLGKAKRGTVEAGDQNAALLGIRSQGVNPTRVEPIAAPLPRPRPQMQPQPVPVAAEMPAPRALEGYIPGTSQSMPNPFTSAGAMLPTQPLLRANSRDMALWYRNMASLVNAGTGMGAGLKSMATAAPTSALRSASLQMGERVMTGAQLSDLMPSFPGLFSPLAAGIAAAGERGGFLVESFERLANYSERDYELQTMVKRETWYPKLVAFASVILNPLAAVALFMQGFGAWLHIMLPVFLKVGFAVIIWYAFVILQPFIPRDNPIKSVWDRVRLYVPIVGKVVRGLATAKWCRAYGALYGAGVGPGEAMRLSAIACGNLALAHDTLAQIPKIERGAQLTEALRATNHFPPLALQMLQIGEQSGDLDMSLNKAADFLESDAETTIKKSVPVIGILMLLFVAFFLVLPQLISGYQDYGAQLDNLSNPDAK